MEFVKGTKIHWANIAKHGNYKIIQARKVIQFQVNN